MALQSYGQARKVQALVDCLVGREMTLRGLVVHLSRMTVINWRSGSGKNELKVESSVRQNRLIPYAESLDNVALAASPLAVVDALWETSRQKRRHTCNMDDSLQSRKYVVL